MKPGATRRFVVTTIRFLAAFTVAAIAALASYTHLRGVAEGVGEEPTIARLLPLSVDGLLVVASLALWDAHSGNHPAHWSARLAFWLGVSASLAANVAHARDDLGARVVAAWPPVALLLAVEILTTGGEGRRSAHRDDGEAAPPEVTPAPSRTVASGVSLVDNEVDPAADASRTKDAASDKATPDTSGQAPSSDTAGPYGRQWLAPPAAPQPQSLQARKLTRRGARPPQGPSRKRRRR